MHMRQVLQRLGDKLNLLIKGADNSNHPALLHTPGRAFLVHVRFQPYASAPIGSHAGSISGGFVRAS